MKKIIVFICFACLLYELQAQNNYVTQSMIPPSPIAESFKRYGDIPVAYNTGVPDISIPLYTIQVGDFSLPITLRYHIKSLRPANCRSNLALGWVLDYGGMISRTIYNKPDNDFGQVRTYDVANNPGTGSNDELMNMHYVGGGYDSEHDIYNYSIPGASGEFILDNTNPHLMSKHPVSIAFAGLNNIDITNDQGTVFKFGYGKKHMVNTAGAYRESSWLLSQVALPSNRTIDFTYEDIARFTVHPHRRMLSITTQQLARQYYGQVPMFGGSNPLPPDQPTIAYSENTLPIDYDEKNIKEINFVNGKVVFDLSSDKKLITGVKIYNADGLLKEFQFVLSGSFAMGEMKFLDKIIVKDKASNTINEYQFQYNTSNYTPDDAGTDYWGYYNGNPLQTIICDDYYYYEWGLGAPNQAQYNVGSYCQYKNADEWSCLRHTLKKIIYPTKGETEFFYGLNEIFQGIEGDGLRIEKIINTDGTGKTSTRTFKYTIPPSKIVPSGKKEFTTTTYSVLHCVESPEQYAIVKTKNVIYDADISSRIAAHLLNTTYSTVSEIIGDDGNNIGRNVYHYQYNDHESGYINNSMGYPVGEGPGYYLSKYKNWDNGLLSQKQVYRGNELNPISVTGYNYIYHYDENSLKNTYVTKLTQYFGSTFPGDEWRTRESVLNSGIIDPQLLPDVYAYYNYDIVTGWVELQSEGHTEYTNAGAIATTIEYQYNGAQKYYPSRIISHNSDGKIKIIDKQYPYDFSTVEPYQTMVSKNIIAPVITETQSLDSGSPNTLLSARKTNYHNWGSNIIRPLNIQESVRNNPLENRVEFDSYDANGNILQLHKKADVIVSYLWEYNKTYPIAEVTNAQQKDIFHTSFENTEGNSTSGDSKTGKKSRTGGYSKSLSNLTNGNYILTWWQKSGNAWSLQTNTIVVSGGTYSINLTGQVDEVRLYPKAAFMTTYTFEPLVGMTSACDAQNNITYYEYDGFGRLLYVRDKDRNIIKQINYQYQQAVQ